MNAYTYPARPIISADLQNKFCVFSIQNTRRKIKTMKKLISFALILLLILPTASCAKATIEEIQEETSVQITEAQATDTENKSQGGSENGAPENNQNDQNQQTPGTENGSAQNPGTQTPGTTVVSSFDPENAKNYIGAQATAYTVGEDQYDIDCDAYLLKNATFSGYMTLVSDLVKTGLIKYCQNGDNGIEGECYQTTLYDSKSTINVSYYENTKELYMTVEEFRGLSPYQIAPQTQVLGTSTVFHMPGMPTVNGSYKFGECEIFQLSNGHFVIVDGAQEFSAEGTVEYLENLTPDDEIPIVDAWFLTHAHPDHAYCVWGIGRDENLVKRIKVEGFYYTWPNDAGMRKESDYSGLLEQVANVNSALPNFRTASGEVTPTYKLHAGMIFYINELEVQILFTQDQMMPSEYGNGFNDSSTSFKFIVHTEGKDATTFLAMGDASNALCQKLMAKYAATTLHTNFFQSLHHGANSSPTFFEYISPDYLNYTHKDIRGGSGYSYLHENCKRIFTSPAVIEIAKVGTPEFDEQS